MLREALMALAGAALALVIVFVGVPVVAFGVLFLKQKGRWQ